MMDQALDKLRDMSQAELISLGSNQHSVSYLRKLTMDRRFTQDLIGTSQNNRYASNFSPWVKAKKVVIDPVDLKIGELQKEVLEMMKEKEPIAQDRDEQFIEILEKAGEI